MRASEHRPLLPSANEIDDFDTIAVLHERVRVAGAPQHRQIVLDRHPAGIDLEAAEQFGNGERPGELDAVAVQRDLQPVFNLSV